MAHVEGTRFICADCDTVQPIANRSPAWEFFDVCIACTEQQAAAQRRSKPIPDSRLG